MARLDRIAPRLPWVAAAVVAALMAVSVPLKTAGADRDDWRYHRNWNGGWYGGGGSGFYFYTGPSYYYAPPSYYYYPPPAYYYPPPYYVGPSFGLTIRSR
jgi:hypothetical protein